MTMRPIVLGLALLPLLAGCLSFGEDPPETLLTLSADSRLPAGPARPLAEGTGITVIPPSVPQSLATLRLPVTTGATSLAFFPKAQWADSPSRLFRDLLAETIAARTGRPTTDLRQYSLAPGVRLGGRLTAFGYDSGSRQAVVSYDATLAPVGGATPQARRFEARADVAAEDAATIGAAINRAANQVAAEVADWIGSTPS